MHAELATSSTSRSVERGGSSAETTIISSESSTIPTITWSVLRSLATRRR